MKFSKNKNVYNNIAYTTYRDKNNMVTRDAKIKKT